MWEEGDRDRERKKEKKTIFQIITNEPKENVLKFKWVEKVLG